MISRYPIAYKYLYFAALSIALAALPYSISLCHGGLMLVLLLWASEGGWLRKYNLFKGSILIQLILMFAFLQLTGAAYTEDASAAWFAVEKKIFLFLVPIALATAGIRFNDKEVRLLLYVFVASCLVAVLICFVNASAQVVGSTGKYVDYLHAPDFNSLNPEPTPWLYFSYIGFANGISIHPTYLSMYLVFCIFFLLYDVHNLKSANSASRLLVVSLIFLFSIAVIFLSSRIMIIILVTAYGITIAYELIRKQSLVKSAYLFTLLVGVASLLYLNPVSRYRSFQELIRSHFSIQPKTVYTKSAEIRASLWWTAWKTYGDVNPVFGAGTGDVKQVMKRTSDQYEVKNILDSYDPHNQFLYTLIANGFVGLLLVLLWMGLPAIRAWQRRDYLLLAFTCLFTAACFTESVLELQKGIVFFTLIHSLLVFQRPSFQGDVYPLKLFRARS